jgi:hypothetical protein
MRHLLLAVLLLTTIGLRAQPGGAATTAAAHPAAAAHTGAASKAPDPAFLNQVYYYWSDSLLPCPKTEGQMENKMKAMGFGGSQMSYTMDGSKAALRIKAGDSLRFVVKMVTMGDPSSMLQLLRFESKKDSRQSMMSSQSRFGGNKNPKNQVSFDVQRSGTDVFILIPSSRLTPGEYGFMNQMQMKQSGMSAMYTFYTFGVDP